MVQRSNVQSITSNLLYIRSRATVTHFQDGYQAMTSRGTSRKINKPKSGVGPAWHRRASSIDPANDVRHISQPVRRRPNLALS